MLHSVVVPLFNCESWLGELVTRIDAAMTQAGLRYELVLVDDGSRDGTYARARELHGPSIRLFRLSRNFGHQEAIGVGLQMARGDRIAVLDDDLQDPPELLPQLFARLEEGWDVVYGVRADRRENPFLKGMFFLFYRLLHVLAELEIPMDAGDFCGMRRKVVDAMLALQDPTPFWRGSRAWVGFRQTGFPYSRPSRPHGKRAYNFKQYLHLALAGFLGYSCRPLRLATWLGVLIGGGAMIFAVYVLFWRLFGKHSDLPGYASIIILMAFLGSAQLVCLGIVGEYLARVSHLARRWPAAVVAESEERPPNAAS